MQTKIKSFILLCFIASSNYLFSQTTGTPLPVCPCISNNCVTDAITLFNYLDPNNTNLTGLYIGNLPPPQTITICGTIYLGDLTDPTIWPLEIPPYVTLQGDYDIGLATGSRIVFPYRFYHSIQCGSQRIDPNQTTDSHSNDSDLSQDDDGTDPSTNSITNDVFVFAMQCGDRFNNICLQGPKPDVKEEFMMFRITDACCPTCPVPNNLQPREGTIAGILARGNDVQINNSEIYGFSFFNIHIRPETSLNWGDCSTDPKGLGEVTIDQCFLHNSKKWGWGYAIYGSDGGGFCPPLTQLICSTPTGYSIGNRRGTQSEMMRIRNTMFMENGKDVDASGNRYSFDFNNCTMGLQNVNITEQHWGSKLCNQWQSPGTCNPNPTQVGPDSQCPVIQRVGGESFSITNSFILSKNALIFDYPNNYIPPSSALCSALSPINALLTVSNNIFFDDYSTSPNDRITISLSEHHSWMKDHFKWYLNPVGGSQPIDRGTPLNTLWVTGVAPNYSFMEINQFKLFNDVTVPGIPHVSIGASFPNSCDRPISDPTRDANHIFVNDFLCFNTDNCLDANLNQSRPGSSMRYIWRWHEKPYDLDDEVRTEHRSIF